jgi:hypothetical protein
MVTANGRCRIDEYRLTSDASNTASGQHSTAPDDVSMIMNMSQQFPSSDMPFKLKKGLCCDAVTAFGRHG